MLYQVIRELEAEEPAESIDKAQLAKWMASPDLDTQGAVYALISDDKHHRRVQPPLTYAEYAAFLKGYFTRCIRENPESEWADSRYSACWDAARWISHFWKDKSLSDDERETWREWLKQIYESSDADARTAIETGILEHLPKNQRPLIQLRGD